MNDNRFQLWMKCIDDDLLEEAQQPLKRRRAPMATVLAAAACLAIVLTVHFLPKSSSPGSTMVVNPMQQVSAEELLQLGYRIPLPADAENESWRLIDLGAEIPMAEVDFEQGGIAYTCRALQTAQSEDISGIYDDWEESLDWNAGTLAMQLRQSSTDNAWVGWYDADAGVQWCLSGQTDGLSLLHTAQQIVNNLGYNLNVAPENAQQSQYSACELDGLAVGETIFIQDGITYTFRMAATNEVEENFADISGIDASFAQETEGTVLWCPARLAYEDGGAGKIVWFDVVPGLLYSLHMDTGASEEALLTMAEELFQPSQEPME